ncbi:hypothetical protein SERLA73DRAFT_124187 [Serpula lacrymans var. lacrymans S7.3]|uniref:FHA domain-containing protein n=2 Tax=Serpula lacrymans var. lacrymans TaxID=341189 RepID=F8Q2T3_SERL3|nr:uncharacterized protein SERLADRAFT_371341 [Serpula lacrymans var. lacrymans S7.9]EGN97494.1 hypothetical protein SERLA73DRAFT_124187 [Serpula lacrymans var. lacrymans S7.3]EGO23096.1 hypothetical protein SERLADRAFT_371341 [Serpula lacrymans var. lacrymans S7.9]
MWLISGPFDGEQGDVTTRKTKLLKTGKKYSLGRKEQPLVINNKKISREHVKFTVGTYLQENMDDVSFIPKLNVFNAKKTILNIIRDTETIVVNPTESYELQDGDAVHVLGGLPGHMFSSSSSGKGFCFCRCRCRSWDWSSEYT